MGLSTPALLFVGLIGPVWVLLYLAGLGRRWGILVPFSLMMLSASLMSGTDYYGRPIPTIWMGLQTNRAEIYMAAGLAAVGVLAVQFGRLAGTRVSVAAVLFITGGLYAALLRFHHGGAQDGVQSTVFALVTLIPLACVPGLAGDSALQIKRLLRSMAIVNAVWVGMCALQFMVDPKALTLGNQYRFIGLIGNPQHAGTLLAFWSTTVLWLLLNDRGKFLRLIYTAILGANFVLLAWSGSRTGMGMTTIGLAAVMYTRLGRVILFLPVIAVLAYMGFKAVLAITGLEVGVDRLATLEDTRTGAWLTLIEVGMANPIMGAGADDAVRSENSWLFAFASYGIGMLGIVLLMTFVAFVEWLRSAKLRFSLEGEDRRLMDLCLGAIAMFFAGAVLEGYIVARINPPICFFLVYSNLAAGLTRKASLIRRGLLTPEWSDDHAAEGEYETYGDYGDYGEGPHGGEPDPAYS